MYFHLWHFCTVPLLLEDMGAGSSLLDLSMWSRACGDPRRLMIGMVERYLGILPLDKWGKHEVLGWLYARGWTEWSQAFVKDGITGANLKLWGQPGGNRKGGSSPNMIETNISPQKALRWALDGKHYTVASQVMKTDPDILTGELDGGVTVLEALQGHQRHLGKDYANAHSLVRHRLTDLEQQQWTFPDLANHLLLGELEDALSVAKAVRMDGAAFKGLVDRKGIDAMVDPVAMVEFAVDSSKQELLEAVLDLMDVPPGEDFISGMLLNAAWNGDVGCLQILLDHGAKVNWQNSNHYTALMRGALRGHEDVVELLLAAGADPTLTNSRRSTAAQLALNKGHEGISRMLREHPPHGGRKK